MPEVVPHESVARVGGSLAPYPGPRSFTVDEADLFFGRERERSQLRSLVLAHSLVLLYAQSGAGKTSLIQAGLIPEFHRRHVTVFPALRIGSSAPEPPAARIENVYVRSIVANWSAAHPEQISDISAVADFPDFVDHLSAAYDASADEARVIIIDQFEEIFTVFPESWQSRGDFFVQVERALTVDPELRVLLSMREDYLAQTDPYAALVSNHLQHRFRLERLGRRQALAAVTGPLARTGREFAPTAAEYLVDQLLQIRFERQGRLLEVRGEYVEPVQLQIVCASLWERLEALPEQIDRITSRHIDEYAEVDKALSRFYDELVSRVASGTATDPLQLRTWCENQLITPGGTRALVYRGTTETEGMPNAVIDQLQSEHLIRGELRAGAHWYELSHDKFVDAIQAGNRQAVEQLLERKTDAAEQEARLQKRRARVFGVFAIGVVVLELVLGVAALLIASSERGWSRGDAVAVAGLVAAIASGAAAQFGPPLFERWLHHRQSGGTRR
ncbi:MAG: ATP-binding protein [Solirubrobacteraceae bacterium]